MRNMIQLAKGDATYSVFFDFNRETQDFDNVIVKLGRFTVPVGNEEMEQLKDTIALEVQLSAIELAAIYKSGQKPLFC